MVTLSVTLSDPNLLNHHNFYTLRFLSYLRNGWRETSNWVCRLIIAYVDKLSLKGASSVTSPL